MVITEALEEQWRFLSAGVIDRTAELSRIHQALAESTSRMLVLEGPPGAGKTTLAALFVQAFRNEYAGGIEFRSGQGSPDYSIAPLASSQPSLLLFDGLDEVWMGVDQTLTYLRGRLSQNPDLFVLVTSRTLPQLSNMDRLAVGPMRTEEIRDLIERVAGQNDVLPEAMIAFAHGNPMIAEMIGQLGRGRGQWAPLIESLRSFGYPGLIDPLGEPLSSKSKPAKTFIANVREINETIMRLVAQDPDVIYQLPPRRFEEISAEMFTRLGYKVELTPASRDGGKDLIIVKRSDLGTALTFVECKRYAPDRPVGVEIVRTLNGVVEEGRATSGIIITSSRFTEGARAEQSKLAWRMTLQDYTDFKEMLDRAMRK